MNTQKKYTGYLQILPKSPPKPEIDGCEPANCWHVGKLYCKVNKLAPIVRWLSKQKKYRLNIDNAHGEQVAGECDAMYVPLD